MIVNTCEGEIRLDCFRGNADQRKFSEFKTFIINWSAEIEFHGRHIQTLLRQKRGGAKEAKEEDFPTYNYF